ncbi:MAG: hypothetical protein N4A72_06215 [Bacteroidales bacterium]|jgi:hypothetical protein|nr:hypothetical protein [Bacteroidales bacterium]
MILSATGFDVKDVLKLFNISDPREIFFKPDNSAKTEAEVKALVGGIFDTRYCSDIAEFVQKKDLRCLLGYRHNVLEVTPSNASLFHLKDASTLITIQSSHSWHVESVGHFYSVNPPTGLPGSTIVTVQARETNNTGLAYFDDLTIKSAVKTKTVRISQQTAPPDKLGR